MLYFWKPSGQVEIIRTENQFQKSNLISVLYLHTPVFNPETAYMSTQFGRLNDYGQFEPEGDPVMMIGNTFGNLFEWVCTVPAFMLTEDGTISFSFTASVLSGQIEGENIYTSATSGVISRYINPSAGVPAPPLDLLTKMQEDIEYLYDHLGGAVGSVSGVFPDENRDVPLIVFQLPENPQEGQIWFDTLEEELPAQLMGYTVTEEEAPVVEETSGYTVMEEPETQLVENTFANEVYDEYVFANNEITENIYKE